MGIIMAVLLGVLSLFLLWTLWGRMAHALQMLQQCHYMNDRFTTWIAGHRLVALPVPLSVLVIAYWVLVVVSFLFPMPGSILTIGTVVIGVLGLGIIKISSGVSKESKKPLKIILIRCSSSAMSNTLKQLLTNIIRKMSSKNLQMKKSK